MEIMNLILKNVHNRQKESQQQHNYGKASAHIIAAHHISDEHFEMQFTTLLPLNGAKNTEPLLRVITIIMLI